MYPEHKPLMRKAVKQAAAGKMFNQEIRLEREGMAAAYVDVSVEAVHGPDGKIIYLLFEARDVTELKAAQEQLRQSQRWRRWGS
jgi:PAS domain-containing protein